MTVGESLCPLENLRDGTAETVARVSKTGIPEFITADGKVVAVLLSPSHYEAMAREFWLAHDVESIRRSMREFHEGEGLNATVFFAALRAELLAMKAAPESGSDGSANVVASDV